MSTSFFQDMLGGIAERGRSLLDRPTSRPQARKAGRKGASSVATIRELAESLLSGRGEASGVAIATRLLDGYASLSIDDRIAFFRLLAGEFGPPRAPLEKAYAAYAAADTPENLRVLLEAVEPPRQELFRRLNLAPGGTGALVRMRQDLIEHGSGLPELACVEDDLVHLLSSWFNRGFLMMQRITWSSPADILERIIRYEAVHTIHGWDDLRRRLQPPDRRCYAFFHPSLIDEPLIFVEVALTAEIPSSIQSVLAGDRPILAAEEATTAVFYSISNCQPGLRGVSFGNFLIKQVVEDLSRDMPGLNTFVTLSPAPGFGRWLGQVARDPGQVRLAGENDLKGFDPSPLGRLGDTDWPQDKAFATALRPKLMGLAATYYLAAKSKSGQPVDPVARFHLGNGARLERLNWLGDTSEKGLRESAGLMVNYLYDIDSIEARHEAFANKGEVAASPAVTRQFREFSTALTKEARNV